MLVDIQQFTWYIHLNKSTTGGSMKYLSLLSMVILIIIGCGKGENGNTSGKEIKDLTPDKWADQVYAIYEKSIVKLDEIIGTKPAITDELKKQVTILKNSIIDECIPLGKARARMSEADQKMCSAKLGLKLDRIASNPAWARTQNDARMFYSKTDAQFGLLVASFNIITQYAQFELLTKQEPAEAKRLGIE
jgi:hypothetical protein